MYEIDRTEVSRCKRVGDDCVGPGWENTGVAEGYSRLLAKLTPERDCMEYQPSERFIKEVRLVENIVAIGRIVIAARLNEVWAGLTAPDSGPFPG
jgi:hypothetical protein